MAITLTNEFQLISSISLNYGALRTYAKLVSQDISTNQSSYKLEARYYATQTVNMDRYTLLLDNFNKSGGYTSFASGETKIQEVTRYVTHNDDGTCSDINVTTSWSATFGGSGSTTGQINCPKINRIAKIDSFTGNDLNGNFSASYTKYINEWTYKLRISIPTVVRLMTINNYISGTNVTLDSTALGLVKNYMDSHSTNQVTIGGRIETWNGNTEVGDSVEINNICTFVGGEPTFTYTTTETNTKVSDLLGSSASTIVENASIVRVAVTPIALNGATITNVSVTHNNRLYSKSTSPYNIDVPVSTNSFTITVTDNRGNTSSTTFTKTLINYLPVDITNLTMKRVNPTSSNIKLNMIAMYDQKTFGSTTNTPVVKWKLDDGSYTTIPSSAYSIDTTNNKLTISNYTLNNALVYTSNGTFTLYIEDLLTTDTDARDVLKGVPTYDVGEHDLQVNGDLYIADTSRSNKKKVFSNTYSTSEIVVGEWINQEPIYRKVIDTGSISSQNVTVAHNITNLGDVISLYGMAKSSVGNFYTLPRVHNSDITTQIGIECTSQDIVLRVGTDANFSSSFVIIEYTKSS